MKKLTIMLLFAAMLFSCTTAPAEPFVSHGALVIDGRVKDLRAVNADIDGGCLDPVGLMVHLEAKRMLMDGKEGYVQNPWR